MLPWCLDWPIFQCIKYLLFRRFIWLFHFYFIYALNVGWEHAFVFLLHFVCELISILLSGWIEDAVWAHHGLVLVNLLILLFVNIEMAVEVTRDRGHVGVLYYLRGVQVHWQKVVVHLQSVNICIVNNGLALLLFFSCLRLFIWIDFGEHVVSFSARITLLVHVDILFVCLFFL